MTSTAPATRWTVSQHSVALEFIQTAPALFTVRLLCNGELPPFPRSSSLPCHLFTEPAFALFCWDGQSLSPVPAPSNSRRMAAIVPSTHGTLVWQARSCTIIAQTLSIVPHAILTGLGHLICSSPSSAIKIRYSHLDPMNPFQSRQTPPSGTGKPPHHPPGHPSTPQPHRLKTGDNTAPMKYTSHLDFSDFGSVPSAPSQDSRLPHKPSYAIELQGQPLQYALSGSQADTDTNRQPIQSREKIGYPDGAPAQFVNPALLVAKEYQATNPPHTIASLQTLYSSPRLSSDPAQIYNFSSSLKVEPSNMQVFPITSPTVGEILTFHDVPNLTQQVKSQPSVQPWQTHSLSFFEKPRREKQQTFYQYSVNTVQPPSDFKDIPVVPENKRRKFDNTGTYSLLPTPSSASMNTFMSGTHPILETLHAVGAEASYLGQNQPPASMFYMAGPQPKPIDPDDQPQEITEIYGDYKWSVKLYVVEYQGYDYAQAFLEDLFAALPSKEYKWHSHTTQGFIQHGGRMSFLVLHNAANGFEWGEPPSSTTSIGVYGRFWYEHNAIHWKTFTPSIRHILQYYEQERYIREIEKWTPDMKPIEKRFHRAYWLAANLLPLRRILNRSDKRDTPHDLPDDVLDDGFELSEDDFQSCWENHDQMINDEEAADTWKILCEDAEDKEPPKEGYDHVQTGGTEWDY